MNPSQIESIYDDEPPERARAVLEPLALAGDPVAQFYMGHLCDEEGPSLQPQALEWYRKASHGGHLEATHWFASFTYHGFGTAADVTAALALFRQCAEKGLASSQWKLGQHLLSGPGNRPEAEEWLKKAASQGHTGAIELLHGAGSRRIELPLRHAPTGRSAAIVRVPDFWATPPVAVNSGKYVLLVASEKASACSTVEAARAWLEAGASYVCAWGPSSPEVEEAFDYAAFLPEMGDPLPFTLMTTNHQSDALTEALWFAFYSAMPPDDLGCALESVVVVVDSSALEARCLAWVQENKE
jgi:TPR repeat protein